MTTNRMGLEQTLSDERLEILRDTFRINAKLCGDDFEAKGYEDSALALDEMLAYRKASKYPVAWTSQRSIDTKCKMVAFTDDISAMEYGIANAWDDIIELYAASPLHAVTVPDEVTFEQAMLEVHGLSPAEAFQKAWNKLRSEMLKSVTNEP